MQKKNFSSGPCCARFSCRRSHIFTDDFPKFGYFETEMVSPINVYILELTVLSQGLHGTQTLYSIMNSKRCLLSIHNCYGWWSYALYRVTTCVILVMLILPNVGIGSSICDDLTWISCATNVLLAATRFLFLPTSFPFPSPPITTPKHHITRKHTHIHTNCDNCMEISAFGNDGSCHVENLMLILKYCCFIS